MTSFFTIEKLEKTVCSRRFKLQTLAHVNREIFIIV